MPAHGCTVHGENPNCRTADIDSGKRIVIHVRPARRLNAVLVATVLSVQESCLATAPKGPITEEIPLLLAILHSGPW
jgi:hypothetical protein